MYVHSFDDTTTTHHVLNKSCYYSKFAYGQPLAWEPRKKGLGVPNPWSTHTSSLLVLLMTNAHYTVYSHHCMKTKASIISKKSYYSLKEGTRCIFQSFWILYCCTKLGLYQNSGLNKIYRLGLVDMLVTHAVQPNFLVWSLPWLYASSVKKKLLSSYYL